MNTTQTSTHAYRISSQRLVRSNVSNAQTKKSNSSGLTRGGMLADVCLVVLWGASIPGLMWLGAVGGF